jgi:hypothetical protein
VPMNTARAELTGADRARLAAILGRLGSDHDGERAAAGLLATRFMRDHGLTWPELLAAPAPATPPPPATDWRRRAAWCAERAELLSAWEASFLASLAERAAPPTTKQAAVLDRLVQRRVAADGGAR